MEESIQRIFEAYGIFTAEVFVIPSCIIVTVCDEDGHSLTKINFLLRAEPQHRGLCSFFVGVRVPTPWF